MLSRMKKDTKIIFIGQGLFGFTGLKKLLKEPWINKIKIAGIISLENNTYVHSVAQDLNIPFCSSEQIQHSFSWISNLNPDLAIMMNFPHKLTSSFIELFKNGIINIHPSDLPKYKGGAPYEASILNEDSLVLTAHFIDCKFDSGPIIKKTDPVDIRFLTLETVYHLSCQKAVDILDKILPLIAENKLCSIKQNKCMESYFWYKDLPQKIRLIFQSDTHEMLARKMNAYSPRSIKIGEIMHKGEIKTIEIDNLYTVDIKMNKRAGEIIKIDLDRKKMHISTKDGFSVVCFNNNSDMWCKAMKTVEE